MLFWRSFFAVTGYFFYIILANVMEFVMQRMFQAQQFGQAPPPFDAPAAVTRGLFGVLSTILLFLMPMITMGIFAEEKKRGTIELLLTSPVTSVQLIMGKFYGPLPVSSGNVDSTHLELGLFVFR